MHILDNLSNTFKTFFNTINCFSPAPRTASLEKALDAFTASNLEVRPPTAIDRTEIKRRIGYPLEHPVLPYRGVARSSSSSSASGPAARSMRATHQQAICLDEMTPKAVKETVLQLGVMLNHTTYKVCGLGALVFHGFTARLPVYMTIACPEHALETILAWAAAAGMSSHPDHPDSFGVLLTDGTTRKVKVEGMTEVGYQGMDSAVFGPSFSRVVTMAALVDAIAEIYVRDTVDAPQRAALQKDVFWLLRQIIVDDDDSGVHLLRRETCPHVWDSRFWRRFNLERPDARLLFDRATYVADCTESLFLSDYSPSSSPPPPQPRSRSRRRQHSLRRVGHRSVAPSVAPTIASDVDFVFVDDHYWRHYPTRAEGDLFFVPAGRAFERLGFF